MPAKQWAAGGGRRRRGRGFGLCVGYSPDLLSLLGNIEVACGIDRVDGKEVRFRHAVDGLDRGGDQA